MGKARFVFIQKSEPSRTRINALYGTETWQPIVHIPRPLPAAGMAALYRMADLCLVTSLQDGMNLVAKEFIASQVDGRGVLVLSELAEALQRALRMPPADRLPATRAATRSVFTDMQQIRRQVAARDRLAVLVDFDRTLIAPWMT